MSKDVNLKILSDITVFGKYAKYIKKLERRETFNEICDRNEDMHLKKYAGFPEICKQIKQVYKDFVKTKKILPSMRSMQFAGKPIEISPNRVYNCCFLPIDDYHAFSEIMFLLLGGTGVGYSVQSHHVENLPPVIKPLKSRRYVIGDSIEGWADAVKALMRAYLDGKSMPRFIFDDIRVKGSLLVTSGGKAPGPAPLKKCLEDIQRILDSKNNGENLTTLEVHDIVCFIADAVLAGGIRRAALISLFDFNDSDMLTCKFGNWWELNPQRGRANNSAVILRHRVSKTDFLGLWEKIKASGSGEPGFYFSNNMDWGTNPCCEIALRPFQFCNLTEINMSNIEDQEDLNERAKAASFLGTLQAGYTDFHYIRDIWKQTTEKDALIGVSGTGIASGTYKNVDLTQTARIVKDENIRISSIIGINGAARTTCVKPAGTSSLVLGSSSGIHAWHNDFFIRRMRLGKNEALCQYLAKNHPELLEDEFFNPEKQSVVSIPIKAPDGAITRHESAIELLERVKTFSNDWVKTGHVKGENTHNVSATISIKDDEWDEVADWMWSNRTVYNGLSVMPMMKSDTTHKQLPFEDITEEEFNELNKKLVGIDLTKIKETEDETDLSGEIACGGGKCEIT